MNKYPIPLYLNQGYVFDLLAMMENGFSHLRSIKEAGSSQRENETKVGGEVGTTNMFSLLSLRMGVTRDNKHQSEISQETSEERVHTPNSLFAKARERLHEEHLVVKMDGCKTGDFVEFKTVLHKNPLVDTLEKLRTAMRMAALAETQQVNAKASNQAKNENKKNTQILETFLKELDEGAFDLLGKSFDNTSPQVVLTMDKSFVSDTSLSDLIDGEYQILGKVTKVISDEASCINLLRKTSFGMFHSEVFDELRNQFHNPDSGTLNLPNLITEVRGPAVQVIPIAIFI
jgi:hypothetical protein